MHRTIAMVSALLFTAGLKAQTTNVQKETLKPAPELNTSLAPVNNVTIKEAPVAGTTAPATTILPNQQVQSPDIKKAGIKRPDIKRADIKKAAVVETTVIPVQQ